MPIGHLDSHGVWQHRFPRAGLSSVSPALHLYFPPSIFLLTPLRKRRRAGAVPLNKEPRQASGCPIMGRQLSNLASPGFGALPSPDNTG